MIEGPRDWTVWIHQQRRRVINLSIGIILVLGFLGLFYVGLSLLSNKTYSLNFFIYLIAYLSVLTLFLVRKTPEELRSFGLLLILYIFGVFSLWSGWLVSGGRVFLLALIVVAAVLENPRIGFLSAGLVLLTYIAFAIAFNQGWLHLRVLPDPTNLTPIMIEGFGFAIAIVLVSTGLWYFGRALMAADRASREAQEARLLLAKRARQLETANALIASQAKSALLESESKLKNVILQASDGMVLTDESGVITEWNHAAEVITGIAAPHAIGKTIWKVQTKILAQQGRSTLDGRQLKAVIEHILQTGDSDSIKRLMDGEIHRPDGTRTYYQQLAFPIKTARGFMLGTIIRDITEKKQIEIEREKLIHELEAKNAELERFTYTVSHDLKSPLITIQGFLGYLEQDASSNNSERLHADIQRINNAAEKMQRLLNELLELSRIGRLMNPPVDIPLASLVRDALALTEGRLKEHNISVQIDPDLPIVHGDPSRLTEVLQNLIDNAAKFMGDQPKPLIHIGLRTVDGQPAFFVEDNGIGIEPRFQQNVFGLFNKLDPHSDGTGIGLALVKRIVEVHGGRIWFESPGAGKGTTFFFTLWANPGNHI